MAKPATRMKSIVLKSYSASRTSRTSRTSLTTRFVSSASPGSEEPLDVYCEELTTPTASVSCSPALRDDLRATIEDMVIPRLVIGQGLPREADSLARRGRVLPTQAEIDLLARIAVQPDLEKALDLAFGMLSAGLSLETVLLHLIGPAARRLGVDWEEDLRSFADVTVGLGTLHEVVHLLARRETGDAVISQGQEGTLLLPKRALLVGGPGEQHTLGLYIFAELLQHSRWAVAIEATMPDSALLQSVRSQSIDLVGISVSAPERLAAVAQLIRRLRSSSQNPALRVLVGGPVDLTREAQQEQVPFFSDARGAVDWLDGD